MDKLKPVEKDEEIIFTAKELFAQVRSDTRQLIESSGATLEAVNGFERRLTESSQKLLDKITLVEGRVGTLENKSATQSDIAKSSVVVKQLGLVIIVLILALVGNTIVSYVKPPTIVIKSDR